MAGTGGDDGASGMMGTLVFVSIFAVLFVLFQSMFIAIQPGEEGGLSGGVDQELKHFDVSTLATYNFYNSTTGGNVYNITSSDYGTYLFIPSWTTNSGPLVTDASIDLHWDAHSKVYVYPIKDFTNGDRYYGDTFIFWSHTGWWDSKSEFVTKSEILAELLQYPDYQQSKVTVTVGDTYTAFFTFDKDVDAAEALDLRTGFSIALGQSQMDQARDQSNMISVVTNLLTLNVQTGNQFLDILIILPMSIVYVWIAVWLLTRIIGAFMP